MTSPAVRTRPRPRFAEESPFRRTLNARVRAHLAGQRAAGDPRLHRKAALILLWFFASYGLMLTGLGWAVTVMAALSWGLAASAVGFNIFHDAGHGSFTRRRKTNLRWGWVTSTLLGPSRLLWSRKHHSLHHRYTNIFQWDDDVESRGTMRWSPDQPWHPRFRRQHWFVLPLYALSSIEWFFVKDFVQYFQRQVNAYQPFPKWKPAEHWEFWITKLLYGALFCLPPFLLLPTGQAIAAFLTFHSVFGLMLTLVVQMAHLNDAVDFLSPADRGAMVDDWATHQLRTTANFATDNPVANWFTGGLNFQVEHHLFPQISHTHYPAISRIVRQTAAEFGLPYHYLGGFRQTVARHLRYLKALGQSPGRPVMA